MADNRVEILVGAQDNSKLDLTALKGRLDALGKKIADAKVNVKGDKEATLALERLSRKLESFGRRTDSAKIGLTGATRVATELLGVDVAFDKLTGKSGRSGGILGGLAGMLSKVGSALGGMLGILPVAGEGLAGLGSGGAAAGAALAPVAAIIAGLVVALGPLIAGLSLITAGFAGFAAAAIPEVTKVWTAVSKGGKAFDRLTGPEKSVGRQIRGLKSEFAGFSKALRPEVLRAFGDALKIVRKVLPALEPAAKAAGRALDGILDKIVKWIDGPSGKKFLKWMQTEGPKAIATFGHFITGLINLIGRILYWWDRLGNDLIRFVKEWAPEVGKAFGVLIRWYGSQIHAAGNVVHALGNVGHALGNVFHAIGNVIGAISSAIGWFGRLASAANNALGGIPGKLLGLIGFAHGGTAGAAAGGARGGLVQVGEHGRELVRLPAGSTVHSNPDTERMLARGGRQELVVRVETGSSDFDKFLARRIRVISRTTAGGDVQQAFGTR